ncbi:unnamed protein product [Merluccius merluccius]
MSNNNNNNKYSSTDYSRSRYQGHAPYGGADDYRRSHSSSLYSSDGSLGNGMSSQTLRKAPLAPTLHPHPQSQHHHHHHQQQQQQHHLPLSSLLDDSEDEVTSSAMSAIAAAAAASCDITSEGREERRDIIGGLLGGLGFGPMGGTSGGLGGATMPLSHPSHPQPKAKRPRKPRDKRDPGSIVRRRRSPGPPGDGSERPYSCQACGKRFRRAETLRRHTRVHTGEKPHACDVCGKTFREPFHLTKHLTVHSGQKNYKCHICGKVFAYAQSLVRHGKLHRKGEIDSQGRRVKGGLGGLGGQVSHAGTTDFYSPSASAAAYPQGEKSPTHGTPSQRLYTCTVCWKSFRHHFHLTAHQQTAHGGGLGADKSYRCDACGKSFAYSNSLVRHKLSQHGPDRGGQPQGAGFSPGYYDQGAAPAGYPGGPHMQQGAPGQQHPFQYRSKAPPRRQGQTRKHHKKKRRVVIHSIMRDGKLVGVPLSKATRRKLLMIRKKRGKMQAQLNRKKLLAQLRIKGGQMKIKSWCGGPVKVTGLSSMEVALKRFPCPVCPSTMYSRRAALLLHHAVRHPPRSSGRGARLRCQVCGKRSASLRRALRHRGRHLRHGAFQCHKCRHRFWNAKLLGRHRYSCRGMTGGGSGNWGLMKSKSPSGQDSPNPQSDPEGPPPPPPLQVHTPPPGDMPVTMPVAMPITAQVPAERSTVLTEYSQ